MQPEIEGNNVDINEALSRVLESGRISFRERVFASAKAHSKRISPRKLRIRHSERFDTEQEYLPEKNQDLEFPVLDPESVDGRGRLSGIFI